jgi:hypothetical protein
MFNNGLSKTKICLCGAIDRESIPDPETSAPYRLGFVFRKRCSLGIEMASYKKDKGGGSLISFKERGSRHQKEKNSDIIFIQH